MYVSVCSCVYVCVCVHSCVVYVHALCTCACMHMSVHIHVSICVCVCAYVTIASMYLSVCTMHVCVLMCLGEYAPVCKYVNIYMHAYVCMCLFAYLCVLGKSKDNLVCCISGTSGTVQNFLKIWSLPWQNSLIGLGWLDIEPLSLVPQHQDYNLMQSHPAFWVCSADKTSCFHASRQAFHWLSCLSALKQYFFQEDSALLYDFLMIADIPP